MPAEKMVKVQGMVPQSLRDAVVESLGRVETWGAFMEAAFRRELAYRAAAREVKPKEERRRLPPGRRPGAKT
jgi:hypothetical protein